MKQNTQNSGVQMLPYQSPELMVWSVTAERGFAESTLQDLNDKEWEW